MAWEHGVYPSCEDAFCAPKFASFEVDILLPMLTDLLTRIGRGNETSWKQKERIFSIMSGSEKNWQGRSKSNVRPRQDSNLEPPDPWSGILSIELRGRCAWRRNSKDNVARHWDFNISVLGKGMKTEIPLITRRYNFHTVCAGNRNKRIELNIDILWLARTQNKGNRCIAWKDDEHENQTPIKTFPKEQQSNEEF